MAIFNSKLINYQMIAACWCTIVNTSDTTYRCFKGPFSSLPALKVSLPQPDIELQSGS